MVDSKTRVGDRVRVDHGPNPYRRPDPWWGPPEPPGGGGMSPWLAERLFNRRIVMLQGSLTGPTASQAAAALLALDAQSVEPAQLHLATPDGDLTAAFTVVDAIDAMRAPLHAV